MIKAAAPKSALLRQFSDLTHDTAARVIAAKPLKLAKIAVHKDFTIAVRASCQRFGVCVRAP